MHEEVNVSDFDKLKILLLYSLIDSNIIQNNNLQFSWRHLVWTLMLSSICLLKKLEELKIHLL